MTLESFKATLKDGSPPAVAPLLLALWHDAHGDWNEAHRVAQDVDDANGAWVHAYLHRKEGDLGNAGYWYRRSGRSSHRGDTRDEGLEIARALLGST